MANLSGVRSTVKAVCRLLIFALLTAGLPVSAKDRSIEEIKARLSEMGAGEDSRVVVKLSSGIRVKGYIGELGKDDFTLVSKDGKQKVLYSETREVKRQKLNVGIKIGIIAGVVIGALLGLMYAQCGSGGCH